MQSLQISKTSYQQEQISLLPTQWLYGYLFSTIPQTYGTADTRRDTLLRSEVCLAKHLASNSDQK